MIEAGYVTAVRESSRRLVRELGFLGTTLAGTRLPPSAVHALIEIDARGSMTPSDLSDVLLLEKSSISRMVAKLIESGEVFADLHEGDNRAKRLKLTDRGRRCLSDIDAYARAQVARSLATLPPSARARVSGGLSAYANALTALRTGSVPAGRPFEVRQGYQPGLIGRIVEMHARYYAREAGFGSPFERKVAAETAEFVERLDAPCNGLWGASVDGVVVGTVAIDGEDLKKNKGHLRWFIVDDQLRGSGIGRELLSKAVAFCDQQGFDETHLWTFRGLDAARRLYEGFGFVLVEEKPGYQWGEEVIEQRFVRSSVSGPLL